MQKCCSFSFGRVNEKKNVFGSRQHSKTSEREREMKRKKLAKNVIRSGHSNDLSSIGWNVYGEKGKEEMVFIHPVE